jgi:hypothetical protein
MKLRSVFDYDHLPWHLVCPNPGIEANSRRWNLVVISVLTLLVMGLLTLAFTPQAAHLTPKSRMQFTANHSSGPRSGS